MTKMRKSYFKILQRNFLNKKQKRRQLLYYSFSSYLFVDGGRGLGFLPRASTVTNKSLASCCTARNLKADWCYCPRAVKLIWLCLGSLGTA